MNDDLLTILIVEDNEAHMKLAAFLLQRLGCNVLRAASAEEGLEVARQRLPDAVLMDIRLPGMDGLAATRLLKSDPVTAAIKVIVVSSYADGETGSPLASGADTYLRKPYHYDDLDKALRELLSTDGLERGPNALVDPG